MCLKVDGKLFAVMPLEVAPAAISFKCTPENFVELCERPGVRPAAYMARAQWVSLEKLNTLPDFELRSLLAESYRLVWERLPKGRRSLLEAAREKATKVAKSRHKKIRKPSVNKRPAKAAGRAHKASMKSPAKGKAAKVHRRA